MKLRMILGLLLAGSVCVGTALQAQDAQDLTQQYLDAIDKARATAETAQTARARRQAEQNVAEFETTLEELTNPRALPSNIASVSVECNGDCFDNTLGEICSLIPGGFRPIAVDCSAVDDDGDSVACPGPGNNRCNLLSVTPDKALGRFCKPVTGADATVFCAVP